MHHHIFGHSFAEFVALILLPGLAFYFLNKMRATVHGNAKDVDIGASGLMTASTETNSGGSSLTESNNGASSSLTASTGNCYEVFLSFRGPDTRKSFTDHLYHGLLNAGIDVFRDNNELSQGKNIKLELLAAITKSKILIPILSEKYGTSSWCLDELVQIMECKNNNGQIVLPIFYKVKPADVRYRIGSFGKAFCEREERLWKRSSFDQTILGKWKKALDEVSTLKGYEANGYEAELVKSIVQKALSELKKKFELVISKNLVGIDSHVNEIMGFVENKSHATLFVGINGMGGIGKTTLAKYIYNKLSNQFEHRSFIADVRETWKHNDVCYLQNKLINDILNLKNEVHDRDEGIQFISSKFKGKKVLILLDDVDNVIQLTCLAGNHDWFYPGSRIIITTRNKKILKQVGVDYTYDHKVMDDVHSLILFCKHAFRRDSPLEEFKDLTHEVVSLTGGLPLSLEVLGSLLCGEEPAFWRGTKDKLEKAPRKEVQETLKISYEALENEQKQIFLDIACFFIGTDSRIASYMWDACRFFPKEGIEVLRFMSLIKIEDNHKLQMHDHLRDLGRTIVFEENERQPQNRSRLWDYKEALKVLNQNKGTDKIEGINLSKGNPEGYDFGEIAKQDCHIYTANQFEKLTSLRFLFPGGTHLSGDFKDSTQELKWLRWPNCPMDFEVKNFHMEELAVFESQRSNINEKWEGWSLFRMAEKLKYLDLSYCALESTALLSNFKKLEVLILKNCWRLERIDASIGDMEALLRLNLNGCKCLRELPVEIGKLEALLCLNLNECKSLRELPAEIGKLEALQKLHLGETESLSTLPDSIQYLKNLEFLNISSSDIKELPKGIERLRKLRVLDAMHCQELKVIMAESLCNLSSLQRLDFSCCELQSLPDLPSGLTYLSVTCQSHQLPSLSHLAHLEELDIHNCTNVKCIPELPSTLLKSSECSQLTDIEESESPQSLNTPFKFESLRVTHCESIETLDVSQCIHLRTLTVGFCNNLLEVQGLDKLIYLESLTVYYCDSIKRLDLPKSEGLKKLEATNCKKLVEVQGLDELKFLESFNISNCNSIERLLLPKFRSLKELEAGNCENLAEIQGLDKSVFLERLDIGSWTSIERLDLLKFKKLKELKVGGCKNLAEILGLDRLEFLESLDISNCTSIGKLLLPKSGRLKKLNVEGYKNLAEIEGFDRLEYLEMLYIEGCTSIEQLDLRKSWKLRILKVKDCKNLVEIQGLDGLESLISLFISGCTSIKRLLLPKSKSLEHVYATNCESLVEIQGLDRLKFLKNWDIRGCKSLKTIPGMSIYQFGTFMDDT